MCAPMMKWDDLLDLIRQYAVVGQTQMREDDHRVRAVLLRRRGQLAHQRRDLQRLEVEPALVVAVQFRRHADHTKPQLARLQRHTQMRPWQRRAILCPQVRQQQRIARGVGIFGENPHAIAQRPAVANCRRVAAREAEQPVHRHALGQVAQPARRLLDVPRVEVEHRRIRMLGADARDQRRHARQPLDAPMDVVCVQDDDTAHRQSFPFSA